MSDAIKKLEEELKQYNDRLVLVQTLKQHEGWLLYESVIAPLHETAQAAAYKAADPWTAAKHLGAAAAYLGLSSWADREIQVAQQMIAQVKERLKVTRETW